MKFGLRKITSGARIAALGGARPSLRLAEL